jgi:hypothetical protein
LIVCVAGKTCLRSKNADEFAATDTEPSRSMSLSNNDAVTAAVVGLQIIMLLITVVVEEGTVYRVVLVVAAAVLASTLVVVGIVYSLS